MKKRMSVLVFVAGLVSIAGPASATLIADSVADFSDTQGQNGWYYGFYDFSTPRDITAPHDFHEMTEFDGARWWNDSTKYWTMIGPFGAHGNGTVTSGAFISVEQWAVRRWVSSFDGIVGLDVLFSKINANAAGNGVTGRIFVDGVQIWSQFLAATDNVGMAPHLELSIATGTIIDFVLDPFEGNDWADNTRFTAAITAVPAPGLAGLMGAGILAAARRRRR